jgi:hypothetical protein
MERRFQVTSAILSPQDVAALDQATRPAPTKILRTELEEIYSELGTAIVQMAPSDDQIICNHVKTAYALTGALLRQVQREPQPVVAVLDSGPDVYGEEVRLP